MFAVIGGTKVTSLPDMTGIRQEIVTTPFGDPSGSVSIGYLGDRKIAFLPRHGDPHMLAPHKINYRANIWALKELGVTQIIAIATSGGIRDTFGAGVLVIPDQIIDYTYGREHTFFDGTDGEPVVHIDITFPYSQSMRERLISSAEMAGHEIQDGGCYGCVNGPRLETAAEIRKMAGDGCDLVGQTGMPETSLALELGIEYAAISPIVNAAAGLGDSAHSISHENLKISRENSMIQVMEILSVFAAQQSQD